MTTPSISIPHPPSFSSVTFKTIGQPPDLLKRLSGPATVSACDDEPDNNMPVSRQSTPTPASKSVDNKDKAGRPSLLQALGSFDGDSMSMDIDIVMASPSGAQSQPRSTNGTGLATGVNNGNASAANRTHTGSHPHPAGPQSSATADPLARSHSPLCQSNIGNNVNLGHHGVSPTPQERRTQVLAQMQPDTQTQASDTAKHNGHTPTPELLYPSGLTFHTPLLNIGGGNGDAASTLNPTTTTSTTISPALMNQLDETMAELKARASVRSNLNVNSDNSSTQAPHHLAKATGSFLQTQSNTRLSPQSTHEQILQTTQSDVSPKLHAQIAFDSQIQGSSAQTRAPQSTSPPINLTTVHSQSQSATQVSSQTPGSPLDSVLDPVKKWLDDVSLAHARFRTLLSHAEEEASTARAQAAIAREEAADASTQLGQFRILNALLREENTKLKEEVAKLKWRNEEQDELERKVEEAIKFGNEMLDALVKKDEEFKIVEQRMKEVHEAKRAEERKIMEDKERVRLAESQTDEQVQRQEDAEHQLQREQDQLRQREQREKELEEKELEQQRQAEEAAAFAKKRAEVMKEKERAIQENARAARERRVVSGGVLFSSSSSASVDNSHAARVNDGSSNDSTMDGGVMLSPSSSTFVGNSHAAKVNDGSSNDSTMDGDVLADDSMVVAAPVPVPHSPSIPESSSPPATATPSISHNTDRCRTGFSTEGDRELMIGLGSVPIQPSLTSHAMNLRHLKADMSRNHSTGAGVKDLAPAPAPAPAPVTKATTDAKIKTEEEDTSTVLKMEEDEDHHALSPLQTATPPSGLSSDYSPSRSQPHSKSHTPVSKESIPPTCPLPPAVPVAPLSPKETPMSSHGGAPTLSQPLSKHSAGSKLLDLTPNQALEPYGNEPTRGHRPPSGSTSHGRDNECNNNQASRRVSRSLVPPAEKADRHLRPYSPPHEREMATTHREFDHYAPPQGPVPTRNIRSRKRPRPEPNYYVPEDDLPVRRLWYEDPDYKRSMHGRLPVEPRYEYANIRDRMGPQTPPLPGRDYHTPEPEPEQHPLRGRSRKIGGVESSRPVYDPNQYGYEQQLPNTVLRSRDWEHQGVYERGTYGPSTANDTTTILSRMDIDDRSQDWAETSPRRQQSPSQDAVPLLARMSDTQHLPPFGQAPFQNNHNRRASNPRGSGQSTRGVGQSRQTRERGGVRGGVTGHSERQSLAARLGSSALQQRLS